MTVSEFSIYEIIPLGKPGTFDENGTSYPSVFHYKNNYYLLYTGWIIGYHVPWYNSLGVAFSKDGRSFSRLSEGPYLPLDSIDPIGIGSSCAIVDEINIKLFYTSFIKWGETGEFRHYYNIRLAYSNDGVNFTKKPKFLIEFNENEYAIARPSVIRIQDYYFMFYSYRGDKYKIGLAISSNNCQSFTRCDEYLMFDVSDNGFDDEMVCYPTVLEHDGKILMFYSGNGYGKVGIGLAWCLKSELINVAKKILKQES